MRAVIVANPTTQHQTGWGGAFHRGLLRHGIQAEMRQQPEPCDLLVLWGVRKQDAIRKQKASGGQVCILERGYLGDRFKWTSVSFGGRLNGKAEFRAAGDDGNRFKTHFGHLMQPWKSGEGDALLIGQVPGDMSLAGGDIGQWYANTASQLREFGRKVIFRPHPQADERGYRAPILPGVETARGPLDQALAGPGLVVTYNSNTAVEAVLAGVPTVATDQGSMAWDVTGHHPGDVVTPPREAWAARLAWCQWTQEELSSGECWAHVGMATA